MIKLKSCQKSTIIMPMSPDTPLHHSAADSVQTHPFMRLSYIALSASILLFFVALFLPVFITQSSDVYGYWVLAMGWLGFISFQFAWYASPLAIIAIYVSRKSPQLGLFLSVIAIIIASEAFLFTEIPFGKSDRVQDYGAGFYIWYLSFYLASFSILFRLVAWGSIEEAVPQPDSGAAASSLPPAASTTAENTQPARPKARRKVIPVVTDIQRRAPHTPRWDTPLPPPLPKKNIYQALTNQSGRANSTPPPLLPFLKKEKAACNQQPIKARGHATPPPLPMANKPATGQPPPLPERKHGSLKIAPFLDNR